MMVLGLNVSNGRLFALLSKTVQSFHVMFVSGNTPEGVMRVTVMKSDAQLAGSC